VARLSTAIRTHAAACAQRVRQQLTGRAALPLTFAEKQLARTRQRQPSKAIAAYSTLRKSFGFDSDIKCLLVRTGTYLFVCIERNLAKIEDQEAFAQHLKNVGNMLPALPSKAVFSIEISKAENYGKFTEALREISLPFSYNQEPPISQEAVLLHEAWHGYLIERFPQQTLQSNLEMKKAIRQHPALRSEIEQTFLVMHDFWVARSMRENGLNDKQIMLDLYEVQWTVLQHARTGQLSRDILAPVIDMLLFLVLPLVLVKRGVDQEYYERTELYSDYVSMSPVIKREAERKVAFLRRALAHRNYLTAPELIEYLEL